MASVAICPHCYLQLIVPDGVERDEPVECPTCAKEFALSQAVLRAIPEIVRKPVEVAPVVETVEEVEEVAAEVEATAVADEPVEITVPDAEPVAEVEDAVEDMLPELDAAPDVDDRMPTAAHEINKLVEAAAKSGAEQENEFVEQVKARIEAELAAKGVQPGSASTIPLDSLDIEAGDELAESVEAAKEDFASWFRDTKTNMELPADADSVEEASADSRLDEIEAEGVAPEDFAAEDVASELSLDASADFEESTPLSIDSPEEQLPETDELAEIVADVEEVAEVVEAVEISDVELEPANEIVDELEIGSEEAGIEEVVARIDAPATLPESFEPRFPRASATTLADLLPPRDPVDDVPGPSFELPNVPLVPTAIPANNGATVEFDSISPLGPAAETEFELTDVNFDAVPSDESAADDAEYSDELQPEESAEADEPVFREPAAGAMPAAPFVIPGVPRPRKKRSVVRTLVGVGLGGAFGVAAALFILLWALGRDGDFLNVAQYLPDAVLPASLKSQSTPQVALAPPLEQPATELEPETEPSENQQASYVEETPAAENSTAEDPLSDDRYAEEPSPLDEPSAEPIAEEAAAAPAATPLPFQGPTITVDQLATALEAAKQAQPGLVDGDLGDAAVRRTKGMSYSKLCDLANALTFVDRSAPSVESDQAIVGAEQLFSTTLADSHTRSEVARIASVWMNSPHRGHGGLFVAGAVSGGESAGDVYEYQFTTSSGSPLTLADGKPVVVLMQEPLDPLLASSAELGIVGHILDRPRDEVVGYTGSAERAIWVTRAIPLE
jgi:hypothetical protein